MRGMSKVSKIVVCLIGILLVASLMAMAKPAPVKVYSISEDIQNSPLGARHWNIFRFSYYNPEDPEQTHCMACHSAVKIVDDPDATIQDFVRAGDKYCIGEYEDPVTGETIFEFATATETGKYADNDFEGITCRVCHVLDKTGIALRRPDNTCTLCHGRSFNWARGSGKHVEQAFYEGQGDGYWDPSVHFTLGMKCEDCHIMNSVKHDYEVADPADMIKDARCLNCHYSAEEIAQMIETTQTRVVAALDGINRRIAAAEKLIAGGKVSEADQKLVSAAKARATFIINDFSEGAHNPQFAAKLINEANALLDKFERKATPTPALDLSDLSVYSQAQVSRLGNRHWDMLERTIFNPADPAQDGCIKCHSAVAIVDDPNAKVADFLPKGTEYCIGELEDVPAGQSPFIMSVTTRDGKYLKNRIEGITCRVCHVLSPDGHIALRRNDEMTCGICHGRTFNWNTGSGKHVELAFMQGQGSAAHGVKDMPSYHYQMGFACQDCHFMDNTKHDYEAATPEQIAANPACSPCHDAKSIGALIESVKKETTAAIAKLQPRLEKAKAYVDKNPANAEAKQLYTQAKAGVTFIENDFSHGVHNPQFAAYLLDRSNDLLDQFEKKFK